MTDKNPTVHKNLRLSLKERQKINKFAAQQRIPASILIRKIVFEYIEAKEAKLKKSK